MNKKPEFDQSWDHYDCPDREPAKLTPEQERYLQEEQAAVLKAAGLTAQVPRQKTGTPDRPA